MHNKKLHMVAFLLLVIGGLNWLLIGVADIDLVSWVFVDMLGMAMLAKAVYVLVGLSAVYELLMHKHTCIHCGAGSSSAAPMSSGGPQM